MDIFKLAGSIVIDGAEEATRKIQAIEDKAKQMAKNIADRIRLNPDIDTNRAVRELDTLTTTIGAQQRTLKSLKDDYVAVAVAQGKDSDAAKALAREIEDLSGELRDNQNRLRDASNAADEFDQSLDDAADSSEKAEGKMSGAFKKIGAAVIAAFAVDKIIDFGKSITEAAATVSAEASAFGQIMGDYSEEAQTKMQNVADATGMMDTRLTPYMTSMTAKFKGLGYGVDEATSFAERGLLLAADASAFWDKSLDDSMGALNSFINGSYEGGEAIGLFANDTQMAMYAVESGLVGATKDWANLDEATKQATRLEYAENMMKTSGATGQAAKEADQYANVQANLNEKWRQFKAQIGEPLLQNIVIPAMTFLGKIITTVLVPAFQKISAVVKAVNGFYKENKKWIDALLVVLGSLVLITNAQRLGLLALTAATSTWKAITAAANLVMKALNLSMLASPITWIIAGIAALVAIIIILIKNWDKVKEAASKAWEWIKGIWGAAAQWFKTTIIDPIANFFSNLWNGIKNGAKNAWNGVLNSVKSIVDKIKGLFNFKWSLPKLKVPKFSINPSGWKVGDLLKGKIPKLSVKWNADGAIFKKPTIFGTQYGLQGVGEAGEEAVAPIDKLQNYVSEAVKQENTDMIYTLDRIVDMLSNFFPQILDGQEQSIVLDSGALVGELAPKMNSKLADIKKANERGR